MNLQIQTENLEKTDTDAQTENLVKTDTQAQTDITGTIKITIVSTENGLILRNHAYIIMDYMETLNSEGIEVIFVPPHKKSSSTDQYIKILKGKTGECLYLMCGYMIEKSFLYVHIQI